MRQTVICLSYTRTLFCGTWASKSLTYCCYVIAIEEKPVIPQYMPAVLSFWQIAATGEEALESLEELEMIFGGVSELGGLERCTRLRTLTRERLPMEKRALQYTGFHSLRAIYY